MLIPWSNSTGAIVGAIVGTVMSSVIAFGSQYAIATGLVIVPKLPVSIDTCVEDYNVYANLSAVVSNYCKLI